MNCEPSRSQSMLQVVWEHLEYRPQRACHYPKWPEAVFWFWENQPQDKRTSEGLAGGETGVR